MNWIQQASPPLKRPNCQGTKGSFVGEHWKHYHWTRQLRRIHSYCHLVRSTSTSTRIAIEVENLWKAITASPGFPHGFRRYWPHRAIITVGSPVAVPKWPPDHATAVAIHQAFLLEFQHFEKELVKARRMEAKQARIQDPHKIYKDTAAHQALPVQTLLTQLSTTVENVHEDGTVTYDSGDLDPALPVLGPEGPLFSLSHTPGSIQLEPDVVEPGDELHQEK